MTIKDHKTMSLSLRRQIARLVQLHKDTHQQRVERRFGLPAQSVRRIAMEMPPADIAESMEALADLQGSKRTETPRTAIYSQAETQVQ